MSLQPTTSSIARRWASQYLMPAIQKNATIQSAINSLKSFSGMFFGIQNYWTQRAIAVMGGTLASREVDTLIQTSDKVIRIRDKDLREKVSGINCENSSLEHKVVKGDVFAKSFTTHDVDVIGTITAESADLHLTRVEKLIDAKDLKTNRVFIWHNVIADRADFMSTLIDGTTSVSGSFKATESEFLGTVTIQSAHADFNSCDIDNILVQQPKSSSLDWVLETLRLKPRSDTSTISLREKTTVYKNIKFESAKGIVYVDKTSRILGKVIGAHVTVITTNE